MQRTVRTTLLASLTLLAPLAVRAADTSSASGSFTSHDQELPIADAYAFRGSSALADDPVLVVAVSNQGFEQSGIDEYWNRRYVLDHDFRDEQTEIVYFELGLDGRYRGLSYDFAPGNGCGYCGGGEVTSTVKLASGRLAGKLSLPAGKESYAFEVTIDVPVSSDDHGQAQGQGGGAPGAAYLAYAKALGDADHAVLRGLLSAERVATWNDAEADGQGDDFTAFLHRQHGAELTPKEAYVKDDQALVLLAGADGKVAGEALFALEDGAWKFEEETIY